MNLEHQQVPRLVPAAGAQRRTVGNVKGEAKGKANGQANSKRPPQAIPYSAHIYRPRAAEIELKNGAFLTNTSRCAGESRGASLLVNSPPTQGTQNMLKKFAATSTLALAVLAAATVHAAGAPAQVTDAAGDLVTLQAGHKSLQKWRLPATPPHPEDNAPNPARVALGKALFFDPRLSGDGNMACASCHSPLMGWSDGMGTGKGNKSMVLDRASPTVFNTAYNNIQMWDGRKKSLEDQAMGPMEASAEMNMDTARLFTWLNANEGYKALFAKAYPGQPIDAGTLSKAIASFERTVVSNTSPFDKWVAGNKQAMTADQVQGFAVFIDPKKGNCAACHSGANFTDNGFHNLGLASWGKENPDVGRFAQKPVASMKGAFKTPTVREAARTAPYFHDGSARTLDELVDFYAQGGIAKSNRSSSMKELQLTAQEKTQLVAFMNALSSPSKPFVLPELPR
jgi:cytochrome c peroxidase